MSSYLKLNHDGRLYVLRPHLSEDPHEWRARHERFCRIRSVVLENDSLLNGFMLLDDLPPEYRDVLDE